MGKAKILIVDDTPANIEVLNGALEEEFETYFAMNGEDALEQVPLLTPDLILLDIMMPVLDGFEVCRRLKDNEQFKDIPIIFITALDQQDDESHGLTLGAADYIAKPFNPDLVLLRVRNHLALKNQRDMLEKRNLELEKALSEIKTLRGIIPIGSSSLCVGNGLYCSSNPLFGGFPELCSLKLFLAWPLASSPPGKSRRSTFPRNQTVSI